MIKIDHGDPLPGDVRDGAVREHRRPCQKSGTSRHRAAGTIRDYTVDKHRNVDDTPYGPGKGMLLQADPIYRTWEAACAERAARRPHVIYLSPQGKTLTQQRARELSQMEHLFLLCGHYEGVDQRVLDEIVDEEISIGDYVLTGGELAALVLIDCVARLLPGRAGRRELLYRGEPLERPAGVPAIHQARGLARASPCQRSSRTATTPPSPGGGVKCRSRTPMKSARSC